MKLPNFQNLLIASLLGLSTLFAGSYLSVKAQSAQDIPIDICLTSESWNRPNAKDQIATLRSIPNRHEPSLTYQEWTSDLILFREYYGLSASVDIQVRAGLFTPPRSLPQKDLTRMNECVDKWAQVGGANPNNNPLIEFWLFKHRMKSIKWTGREYIITVEPKNSGFQLGYFKKQSPDIFAVKVINTKGQLLAKCESYCKFSKPK